MDPSPGQDRSEETQTMASNTVYHYTFSYDATGGGDKGGSGDWYKGWTADMSGVYQQGQTIKAEHGTYKIDAVQTYNYDLEQAHGKNYEAKSVYVTTYHDEATKTDYKPYHYSELEKGVPNKQSGHGGLGSEQDYVWKPGATDAYGNKATPDEWHNFGAGGDYSYGGAKPDQKYSFTYHDADSGSWYKGWVVDEHDKYTQGQRVDTAKGWYSIDKEEAVPYSTGWHPEPKDHKYDNGHVHITEYYKAATGKTYGAHEMWSTAKGDGWASSYDGLGHETDYVSHNGGWQNYVSGGDVVW
jgi:hypothetical protein